MRRKRVPTDSNGHPLIAGCLAWLRPPNQEGLRRAAWSGPEGREALTTLHLVRKIILPGTIHPGTTPPTRLLARRTTLPTRLLVRKIILPGTIHPGPTPPTRRYIRMIFPGRTDRRRRIAAIQS